MREILHARKRDPLSDLDEILQGGRCLLSVQMAMIG